MDNIIRSIEELDKYKDELAKIKVWICLTATGKSYLTSIDDRFFDMDMYRSKLKDKGIEDFDAESVPMMYEMLDKGKIVLNASHSHIMNYLHENKIPYVYIYGKPQNEPEYIERMLHRGSGQAFVDRFGWMVSAGYEGRTKDKRPTFKIELDPHQFVSDYAWRVFGRPKKYIQFENVESEDLKIAFVDIDGTLVDLSGKLTEHTIKVIKSLKDRVKIVLTSGRGLDRTLPVMKALGLTRKDDYAICAGGSLIIKGNGEKVFSRPLKYSDVKVFIENFGKNRLKNCYVSTPNGKIMLSEVHDLGSLKDAEIYKIVYKPDHKGRPKFPSIISSRFHIYNNPGKIMSWEFVEKNVTKEGAVSKVLKLNKLEGKNAIAIGDMENDIEMMKLVGCSIAVCNADVKVKQSAKYITDSNNDDGVAKALERIFK